MSNTRIHARTRWLPLSAALMLLLGGIVSATLRAADGAKGKAMVYEAKVAADQGDWYFRVELEPVLFRLVTVQNKYKPIRINIRNRSSKPLKLSLANDRIQVYPESNGARNAIDGILDISRTEPAWWQSLDQTMKNYLAYPDQAAIKVSEEENVFVFVPVDKLPSFPSTLALTIKSYSDTPIRIARQNLATAK
jgi:hypothetical protein